MASLLVLLTLIVLVAVLRLLLTPSTSWGANPYRSFGHHKTRKHVGHTGDELQRRRSLASAGRPSREDEIPPETAGKRAA
ncbi:hypothetical protein [Salininema proteolyticum]|uniref:Secreted protein n=1 Tax=Salininema proteolyticum TaxID=1607685 RepID=A0ABV8U020_9ACTN